jgi:hypothetical protein
MNGNMDRIDGMRGASSMSWIFPTAYGIWRFQRHPFGDESAF